METRISFLSLLHNNKADFLFFRIVESEEDHMTVFTWPQLQASPSLNWYPWKIYFNSVNFLKDFKGFFCGKFECVNRSAGWIFACLNSTEDWKNYQKDFNASPNANLFQDKIFLSKCECVTRLAGLVSSSINHLCLPRGQVTSPPPPHQCSLFYFFSSRRPTLTQHYMNVFFV